MKKQDRKKPALPSRFEPQFWAEADGRLAVTQEIKRRIKRLKEDSGADSYQKNLLCEKAVFLAIVLETMERNAAEGTEELDFGRYTQGLNALVGLLRTLGLERRIKEVVNLSDYKKQKAKA